MYISFLFKRLQSVFFLLACLTLVVGLLPRAAQAALASSYTVNGAGTTSDNGIYTPNGTYNGTTIFKNSNNQTLFWGTDRWYIGSNANCPPDACIDYYSPSTGASATSIPASGWYGGVAYNGLDPAPTVNASASAPTITSFSPTTAAVGSTVTLTGTGFTGATSVTVGATNAPSFTIVSDTSLTFTVPAGATSGTISVTTPAGTGTSAGTLTISGVPPPSGQLTNRSLTLGSSSVSAVTTHQFSFTTATTSSVGSIGLQYCTTASGSCVVPTGLSTTAAFLSVQTGATGLTLVATTNGAPYLTRTASSLASGTPVSLTLSSVTNPSNLGTFYVRLTTYTGTNGATGAVDQGTVSASTAGQLTVQGTMDEILSFCVGATITGTDCTTVSGSSVPFGSFSSSQAKTGTTVFVASTNGGSGYTVSVSGRTLTSGARTIPALAAKTSSALGTSQFGLNVALNTAPAVGASPTGSGSGSVTANYNTPNQFRYVSGDTLASAPGPTAANAFTVSYLVNVAASQAAGAYSTNLTYVCTAGF